MPQAATRAATRSCFPAPRCPQMPLRCRAAVVPRGAGSSPRLGVHRGVLRLFPSFLPPFPSSSPLSFLTPCSLLCPCLSLFLPSLPPSPPCSVPVPLSVLAPVLSALLRSLPGRPSRAHGAGTASPARALCPHVPGRGREGLTGGRNWGDTEGARRAGGGREQPKERGAELTVVVVSSPTSRTSSAVLGPAAPILRPSRCRRTAR